jgi:membrane-associated phospholipid phosphatase
MQVKEMPSSIQEAPAQAILPRLRTYEWFVIFYFLYVAILAGFYFPPLKAYVLAAIVAAVVIILAKSGSIIRDIFPMTYLLVAYREMDWFTPATRNDLLERSWLSLDHRVLDGFHLRSIIESAGPLFPSILELSYLLVYTIAAVSVTVLLLNHRRAAMSTFWIAYLAGTLATYALFPFFPSQPPRTLFPGADLPEVHTAIRAFNLWVLGSYAIHSSVFPSAHVSSAFSAAWGLRAAMPARPWFWRGMAIYGLLVAIATVYGRYHYTADALAGFGMSLLAFLAIRLIPVNRTGSPPR